HNIALLRPFAGLPWSGIVHSLRFHLRQTLGLRWQLSGTLQKSALHAVLGQKDLCALVTLDPLAGQTIAHPRLKFIPDPVSPPPHGDRTRARTHFGIDPSAFVILVYGSVDYRKCLDLLLPAAREAAAERRIVVFVAGVQRGPAVSTALGSATAQELL